MAGFVPDASATLPWCFADEATPETEALLDRLSIGEEAVTPAHWPVEVLNSLLMAMRRGRVSVDKVSRFIEDLAALPVRIEPPLTPASWSSVLDLAATHRLTIYDAVYLELAQRRGLALATLDEELRGAAKTASVPLLLTR